MTVLRLCVSMFSRKGPFFNYSLSGMNILRFISPSLSIYCCIVIRFSIFLRSTSISKAEYSSLVTSLLDTLAGVASTANWDSSKSRLAAVVTRFSILAARSADMIFAYF